MDTIGAQYGEPALASFSIAQMFYYMMNGTLCTQVVDLIIIKLAIGQGGGTIAAERREHILLAVKKGVAMQGVILSWYKQHSKS